MKPLCGFGASPSFLPWPESAEAVAFASLAAGFSRDPRTPQPASPTATKRAARSDRSALPGVRMLMLPSLSEPGAALAGATAALRF